MSDIIIPYLGEFTQILKCLLCALVPQGLPLYVNLVSVGEDLIT